MEVLSAAMRQSGADRGLIRANEFDDIHLCAKRTQGAVILPPHLSATRESGRGSNIHEKPTNGALTRCSIGPFTLVAGDPSQPPEVTDLDGLVQSAEAVIGRYRVYRHALREWGIDISSVVLGCSLSQRSLESAICKIARSDLPVLIRAEFGSDVVAAAATIHCMSERQCGPFIALDCACQRPESFRSTLCSALEEAAGGSLLLSEVDMLDSPMQRDLLSALAGPEFGLRVNGVRVLSAACRSLTELVHEGRFSRLLCARLEHLKLDVPPLRDRREDIRPLVEYEIGERLRSLRWMSEDAMRVLEQYTWPGNLGELRQVVSQAVIMSDSECIALEDLAEHSGLRGESGTSADEATMLCASEEVSDEFQVAELEESTEQGVEAITLLARNLAAGNTTGLAQYGLGLQRALTYVSQRYQNDISLTELAENAYLSASHLSFLFKKMLGAPFKTVLAVVRIEKAKQLLAESPNLSITEVSLNAGFGDLSHFERTFKRIVGLNPRAFRRELLATDTNRNLMNRERASSARRNSTAEQQQTGRENRNPRQVFELR